MTFLSKLRQRVNRDDGMLFRIGYRHVGRLESIGLLSVIGGLLLWQLHSKTGLSWIWAAAAGSIGLVLSILGGIGKDGDSTGKRS